jgi:hypothetical protein
LIKKKIKNYKEIIQRIKKMDKEIIAAQMEALIRVKYLINNII